MFSFPDVKAYRRTSSFTFVGRVWMRQYLSGKKEIDICEITRGSDLERYSTWLIIMLLTLEVLF